MEGWCYVQGKLKRGRSFVNGIVAVAGRTYCRALSRKVCWEKNDYWSSIEDYNSTKMIVAQAKEIQNGKPRLS